VRVPASLSSLAWMESSGGTIGQIPGFNPERLGVGGWVLVYSPDQLSASMRFGTGISTLARTVVVRAALVAAVAGVHGCGDPPTTPTPPPPPSLTCPANITVPGVVGATEVVTYTPPAATGGAAPVTTSCTPAPGFAFPVGSTAVTCTAIDAQNRQATCAFSVTLQPAMLALRKFLAFGDSVTAGEDGRRLQLRIGFIDPLKSYPAILQGLLRTDFPDQGAIVINEGFSGIRAKDDVDRLVEKLDLHEPEALLLLHGYNDLLNDGVDAVSEVVAALREDIQNARSAGVAHVFLSTMTPSRPATGRFNRMIDPEAINDLNRDLVALAAVEQVHLVDAFTAFAGRELELVEEDGLHLTVAGNQVLAETFYAAIRQISTSNPAPLRR
jgi:lysophospholipase L1-like esterase